MPKPGLNALIALLAFALADPALAEKIVLENGDEIEVTILEETEEELVVEHPQLGLMTVPRSALKPPEPPNPGLFGTDFLLGWNRNAGFGFSGSSGTNQDASINMSLAADGEGDTYRGNFNSAYFYSTQNDQANSNEFFAAYSHDFLLGESGFFLFGRGRYQYDEFQPWEHRISANAGGGYDILTGEGYLVSFELGAGVARTEGIENEWIPEGLVALKGEWRPFEGHRFTFDVTYFPNLDDLPEFRALINAAYAVAVSPIEGLSVKIGVKNEYDSLVDSTQINPATGRNFEKNNLKYFGNLVYAF